MPNPKKDLVSLLESCHFTFEKLSVETPDVFLGCQSIIECCESATRNMILSKERHRYATGMNSIVTVAIYILAQHSEANFRLSYFLTCLSYLNSQRTDKSLINVSESRSLPL